jgi:hypothetical protein
MTEDTISAPQEQENVSLDDHSNKPLQTDSVPLEILEHAAKTLSLFMTLCDPKRPNVLKGYREDSDAWHILQRACQSIGELALMKSPLDAGAYSSEEHKDAWGRADAALLEAELLLALNEPLEAERTQLNFYPESCFGGTRQGTAFPVHFFD